MKYLSWAVFACLLPDYVVMAFQSAFQDLASHIVRLQVELLEFKETEMLVVMVTVVLSPA